MIRTEHPRLGGRAHADRAPRPSQSARTPPHTPIQAVTARAVEGPNAPVTAPVTACLSVGRCGVSSRDRLWTARQYSTCMLNTCCDSPAIFNMHSQSRRALKGSTCRVPCVPAGPPPGPRLLRPDKTAQGYGLWFMAAGGRHGRGEGLMGMVYGGRHGRRGGLPYGHDPQVCPRPIVCGLCLWACGLWPVVCGAWIHGSMA